MRGCNRWSENGIKISQNISKSNKTKKLTFSQKTQVYIPAHPHYSPSLCTVLDTTQTQWPSYHQSLPIHTSVIYNCFKMKPLNPITLRVLSISVIFPPWTPEATRWAGISNEHVKLLLLSTTFYFSAQFEYRVHKIHNIHWNIQSLTIHLDNLIIFCLEKTSINVL